MPPLAELHLVTLGRCTIERHPHDGGREPVFGPGKPFAVLAYLAAAPHRAARREQLLDLLWADTDPDKARNSLRQVIWLLRSRLGDEVLSADGDRIALHRAVVADRDEFLAAVDASDPAAAIAKYGGPFLPDLASPGGAEFDHWADVERQHLHAAYVRAAELRVRQLLDDGRAHQAAEAAEVLRSRGPLREASWRLLIEALLADHNTLGATAQADGLVRMLQGEGRDPEPASRRLLARCELVHGIQHLGDHRSGLVAELIGREAQFSAAIRLWRDATHGRARHLHISAEAGLGKSRLLADVSARIRAQGGRVITVRGRAGERNVAWMIAADLARALADLPGATSVSPAAAGALIAMEPSLAPRFPGAGEPVGDPGDLLRQRASALRELLVATTLEAPLALAIDDLHWMDPMSTEVIGLALTRVGDRPILVLSAARPTPQTAPIAAVDVRAELTPLTATHLTELLASLGTLPPLQWVSDLVGHLCRTTDGNPLLVLESVAALIDRRLLALDDLEWTAADPDALLRVARAPIGFAERVARLSAHARAALDAIAVAPIALPAPLLGRALGHPPGLVAAALDELEREGMALRHEAAWEPAHDRVRERALALMTPEARQRLERAVCREAASDDDVPDRLLPALAPVLGRSEDARDLERMYRRWFEAHRALGDRRSDRALARDLLGAGASAAALRQLLRSRPLGRRIGGIRAAGTTFGALLILGGWGVRDWAGQPAELALIVHPIGIGNPGVGLVPAPVLEIRDRLGRRVRSDSSLVTATIVRGGRISGDTAERATEGRVVFQDLSNAGDGSAPDTVLFDFTRRGLPPIRYAAPVDGRHLTLDLISGTLAGQRVAIDSPVVTVRPGQEVTGNFEFVYTTRWAAAAVMLGAVATWRHGPASVLAQIPLITPIEQGRSELPIRFRAPSVPGRYHIVFAFGAEPDFKWVASGTNWTWGRPVWGDGNDISEWSDSVLDQVRRTGRFVDRVPSRAHPRDGTANVPSRVVDVVVE